MGMTRVDKFEEIFGYRPATDQVLCNGHDWCGENDACNYCSYNSNNIGREEDWWNAEYKEQTTKNDLGVNCISRAQAQTEIEMSASRYTIAKERGGMGQVEWSDQLIKVSDAVDIIRHLPSVTPQEPKTGHWIDCDNSDDYSADGYDCSVCGVNAEYATSYCPNCGAKMVESQESEAADD